MNKEQYRNLSTQTRRNIRNRELLVERALRRSSFGCQCSIALADHLAEVRASIIADCQPALQAMRDAQDAMDGVASRIRGYVADGYTCQPGAMDKYSRTRSVSGKDDDSGMADNSPLWTAGHALAARDSAKV